MTLAEDLAARVVASDPVALVETARDRARLAIMDALGCALAGAREAAVEHLKAAILTEDGSGPALILGTPQRTSMLDAALVNGTALHVLDYDDFNATIGGHPTAPLVPALLALGEKTGASGADFLAAYLVGFETEARIAAGVNFHHYEKGWHPTVTMGVFGTAAAGCRLLGLDAGKTAMALAIAVSLASGVKANFGSMTKSLHVGHCARSGLFAALLAERGFTGNPSAFEHPQGFLEVFNGAGTYDVGKILDDWWAPPQIIDPGVVIKQHPCCASAHAPIDAMLSLIREKKLDAADIASVEARCHPRRLAHTDKPDPQSPLDAKFSVQYCVARALRHGQVRLDHFAGDAYADPTTRAVMERITVLPFSEDEQRHAAGDFAAVVRLTRRDGGILEKGLDRPAGYAADDPLPPAQVRAKFIDCAGRALGNAGAERVADALARIDSLPDLRTLTGLIAETTLRQ